MWTYKITALSNWNALQVLLFSKSGGRLQMVKKRQDMVR